MECVRGAWFLGSLGDVIVEPTSEVISVPASDTSGCVAKNFSSTDRSQSLFVAVAEHWIDRVRGPMTNRAECPEDPGNDPDQRFQPSWRPSSAGGDRKNNTPRPSPQIVCQPTAYLAEVTSLSPGLPPQRLPGVCDPQQNLNPESGSFLGGVRHTAGSANIRAGVESNPYRIEVMEVGPDLG